MRMEHRTNLVKFPCSNKCFHKCTVGDHIGADTLQKNNHISISTGNKANQKGKGKGI